MLGKLQVLVTSLRELQEPGGTGKCSRIFPEEYLCDDSPHLQHRQRIIPDDWPNPRSGSVPGLGLLLTVVSLAIELQADQTRLYQH